jgi:hypothetical protein
MKLLPHVFLKEWIGSPALDPPKQWQRLLARCHESQLTQRDFANRHGVGLAEGSAYRLR